MSLNSMKLSSRMMLSFGLVIGLFVIAAATSLQRLNEFNDAVEHLATQRLPKLIAVQNYTESLLHASRQMRDALLLDDEKEIKASISAAQTSIEQRKLTFDQLQKNLDDATERSLFEVIRQTGNEYARPEAEFLAAANKGEFSSAKDILLEKTRPAQIAYLEALKKLSQYHVAQSAQDASFANHAFKNTLLIIIVLSSIAVLVGVMAAGLIIRNLSRQLGGEPSYVAQVVNAISAGNLNTVVNLQPQYGDSLLAGVKKMQENLQRTISQVQTAVSTISTASHEIAQGNSDLSSRTEQQAGALEETAASMQELTETVKQNAEHARQADMLAISASGIAEKGGAVVSHVVQTMSSINDSSKKIVDIISVIDGIAFQTNILALNAAVEAARAGEQGRGFAVVASEVRNLAQSSSAAAKQIKELIVDSVDKVHAGSKLVDEAGSTMSEIVASVARVTQIIAAISQASEEQSKGLAQINSSISAMDDVTQQNATLVEEAANAAESLKDQADQLAQAVSVFQLGVTGEKINLRSQTNNVTSLSSVRKAKRGRIVALLA